MVQRQGTGVNAAVLALVVVSGKHLAPREPAAMQRALHEVDQPDHRGLGEQGVRAVKVATALLQGFGLAAAQQRHRSPNVADIERLVVLIENQNGGGDHLLATRPSGLCPEPRNVGGLLSLLLLDALFQYVERCVEVVGHHAKSAPRQSGTYLDDDFGQIRIHELIV